MPQFTQTQLKLLSVLNDGMPHTRDELMLAHGDPEVSWHNMLTHIVLLRKKLKTIGRDVVCVHRGTGQYFYQQVVLLVPDHIA